MSEMTDDKEEWRPVVGFEGRYEVSDQGRVRNVKTGLLLTLARHLGGYRQAHLHCAGQRFAPTVHKLVLEAFVGPRPHGKEALHRDGHPENNRLDNLRWGTKIENEADKNRHGTRLRGERSALAKLTVEAVRAIRARAGEPQQDLADEFGCTYSNISAIQLRKSWRHV